MNMVKKITAQTKTMTNYAIHKLLCYFKTQYKRSSPTSELMRSTRSWQSDGSLPPTMPMTTSNQHPSLLEFLTDFRAFFGAGDFNSSSLPIWTTKGSSTTSATEGVESQGDVQPSGVATRRTRFRCASSSKGNTLDMIC